MDLKQKVKTYSESLGFDLFAVAPVEIYTDYLADVKNRMREINVDLNDYMISSEGFFEKLSDPFKTLPTAKSIIILGVYSFDEESDYKHCNSELRCKTARTYSYYPVIRELTQKLASYIEENGYETVEGQNLPLKYVSDKIGLGTYGKNGLLLTEKFGSFIALRNIITDMPLELDSYKNHDYCEGCNACIKACPTKALYAPYKVNPKLCLNPVGRKEEHISPKMRKSMRTWLRGCDLCQEACPVNRNLIPRSVHPVAGFNPENHESHKDLGGLEKCPEALELIKKEYPWTIRRNAVISLVNIGKDSKMIIGEIQKHMVDTDERLKDYFSWAIDELSARS